MPSGERVEIYRYGHVTGSYYIYPKLYDPLRRPIPPLSESSMMGPALCNRELSHGLHCSKPSSPGDGPSYRVPFTCIPLHSRPPPTGCLSVNYRSSPANVIRILIAEILFHARDRAPVVVVCRNARIGTPVVVLYRDARVRTPAIVVHWYSGIGAAVVERCSAPGQ